MTLTKLVLYFEKNIENFDKTNPNVSNSTVAWQIDHSLKVINNVCKVLIKSDPDDYQWKFNFYRSTTLPINYFPRGKVKAPKGVRPEYDMPAKETLTQAIADAKSLLKRIENLPENSNFKHPIFGLLNLKTSKRFLKVHSYHHYKIIREILS